MVNSCAEWIKYDQTVVDTVLDSLSSLSLSRVSLVFFPSLHPSQLLCRPVTRRPTELRGIHPTAQHPRRTSVGCRTGEVEGAVVHRRGQQKRELILGATWRAHEGGWLWASGCEQEGGCRAVPCLFLASSGGFFNGR